MTENTASAERGGDNTGGALHPLDVGSGAAAPVWCLFFASIASIRHHPGVKNPDLEYCAFVADEMLAMYKERFLCRSGLR